MAATFRAEREPDDALIARLARLEPLRAFCTPGYVAFRRSRGDTPWLLALAEGGAPVAGCMAFMRAGRLNTSLEIPSAPGPFADDAFWSGLRELCRQSGVTRLSLETFASNQGALPVLGPETARKARWEYLVDLTDPEPFQGMRKGHRYSLKLAARAGLALRRARDPEACRTHARLMDASMSRRQERGEAVEAGAAAAAIERLAACGAGELFQAMLDGEAVSSNMILVSSGAGYNHTSGTGPRGMDCGAAQFLVHEIAMALRAEGKSVFNLGGTDEPGSGLERFKTGFGKRIRKVALEAVEVRRNPGIARLAGIMATIAPRGRAKGLAPVDG